MARFYREAIRKKIVDVSQIKPNKLNLGIFIP